MAMVGMRSLWIQRALWMAMVEGEGRGEGRGDGRGDGREGRGGAAGRLLQSFLYKINIDKCIQLPPLRIGPSQMESRLH